MVQTSSTSHDVKRCRTTSRDDCAIPYILGHRVVCSQVCRQFVARFVARYQIFEHVFEHDQKPPRCRARPQMAAASYNIARLRTIHPPMVHDHPNFVVVRCLKAVVTMTYFILNISIELSTIAQRHKRSHNHRTRYL